MSFKTIIKALKLFLTLKPATAKALTETTQELLLVAAVACLPALALNWLAHRGSWLAHHVLTILAGLWIVVSVGYLVRARIQAAP